MKKRISVVMMSISALLILGGCGAGDNTTAAENEAYKNPDKSNLSKPPADAMKPPANFKSSINDGPQGAPPGPGG